jgi:hypothetical protein
LTTSQPCHCEAVFAEAVSRLFSENSLLEIASSQKALLAMTKVDIFMMAEQLPFLTTIMNTT